MAGILGGAFAGASKAGVAGAGAGTGPVPVAGGAFGAQQTASPAPTVGAGVGTGPSGTGAPVEDIAVNVEKSKDGTVSISIKVYRT